MTIKSVNWTIKNAKATQKKKDYLLYKSRIVPAKQALFVIQSDVTICYCTSHFCNPPIFAV